MNAAINQVSQLFFPKPHPESTEVTFKIAMDALNTQRIARITKTAIYALASIAATVTLVLTEAAIISWPLAIPSLVISIIAGIVFYRLNSLDKRYVEMLDDKTRESVAKKELERLFFSEERLTADEIKKSLNDINRLMGVEIFNKEAIDKILHLQNEALLNDSKISLGAFAFEKNEPIVIASVFDWAEQGRFSLPSYEKSVEVTWSGNPADPINVSYKDTPKPEEAKNDEAKNDGEKAVEEPSEVIVENEPVLSPT